jgi:hypothetical protein
VLAAPAEPAQALGRQTLGVRFARKWHCLCVALFEQRHAQRLAVKEALYLLTLMFAKEVQLRLGFDAFGDDVLPKTVGNGQDAGGDQFAIAANRDLLDEAAIDFNRVKEEHGQIAQ